MADTLKSKAVKGLAWSTFNTLVNQVLGFVIGIILARLLTPADYGLTAMIGVFTAVLMLFTDGGLTSALIRKEYRTEADMATVFWYNLVTCWSIYGILFIAAPYIADFYNMPVLKDIARVTTLGLLIGPFGVIQSVIMTTRIDFKTPAVIGFVAYLVSGVVGISLAYMGYGVWALVVMGLVGSFLNAVVRIVIIRWYPKTGFSKASFKELFAFSSKILGAQIVWRIYSQIAPLVIGKYYSPAQLGVYNRAKGWAELPSNTFFSTLYNVAYPVLSKIQDDDELLRHSYNKFIRMTGFCCFPLMIGLAAVSEPLNLYVLTEKWSECTPLLQILCFSLIWLPINALNQSVLLVKGHGGWYFKLTTAANIVVFVCMCCSLPFGLKAFCYGQVCAAVINLFLNTYYTGKVLKLGFIDQFKEYADHFLNCCVMGGLCMLIQTPFDGNGIKLLVAIPVGAIYYLISSYFFFREDMMEIIDFVKSMRSK